MKLSGRRIIVSILLLSTMFVGSASAASTASAATRRHGPTVSERRMVSLINKARAHANRWDLKYSEGLSRIARAHSAQMARSESIYHTTNLGHVLRNLRWSLAGENVGMGATIDSLHEAFMLSPGHRRNNLEKRFHRFGVGVIWKNGVAYITVEFMS
jgi:uncharacterized protein YkwD